MSHKAVISLAILKVNSEQGKDYIENFVPFVLQCVCSIGEPVISVAQVQTKMQEDFGLNVPQNALNVIFHRASRQKYFTRDHGAFRPNMKLIEEQDFETVRQRVLRDHEFTIQKLIDFVAKYNVIWGIEKAEDALHIYLKKYDVDILKSATVDLATSTTNEEQEFLINSYLKHLCDHDREGLEYIITLVRGNMLANTLLFGDISHVQRKFQDTAIYCDTRFILRVLGYHGPLEQAPCRELLELLYVEGAYVKCFQHTFEEVKNVLSACRTALAEDRDGVGSVFLYLRDKGVSVSDVDLNIARLDKTLGKLRIEVVGKPEYAREFQINETGLETALQTAIGYREERELARRRDVDSLSAIHRLRRGQTYDSIENCRAIFLTCNYKLVKVAGQYFGVPTKSRYAFAPIVIADTSLTTLLWLKRPASSSDLPHKCIIAHSYAAMTPQDNLWRMYLKEIDKLEKLGDITPDDVYLLRYSQATRVELMEQTLGDDRAFIEGTVPEILDRVKSEIKAESEAEVLEKQMELEKIKREHEEMLVQQDMRELARTDRRQTLVNSIAKWTSRFIFYSMVFLLIAGSLATILTVAFGNISGWLLALLLVPVLIVLALGIANGVWGITVKHLQHKIELRLAKGLENKLRNLMEPQP
jgi:hypothetical protein